MTINLKYMSVLDVPFGLDVARFFISINMHQGTKEGFGGSKISLRIKEPSCMFPKIQAARVHTFKGDLWDGSTANKLVAEHLGTKLFNVGIKKLRDRNSCFWAGKVTEKFMETLSKAVILGQPVQGDFSEDLKEPSHG